MKTPRFFQTFVVVALVFSILACSGQPAATPTPIPSATPISMATHTDETGAITVSVPSEWTDVDGAASYANSYKIPQLIAATNKEKLDEYSGSGIVIWTTRPVSMTADEAITLAMNKASGIFFNASCKKFYDHSYYDLNFDGKKQMFDDCSNFDNTLILLISKLAKTDVIVYVMMIITPGKSSAELEPLFKTILDSLKVDTSLIP